MNIWFEIFACFNAEQLLLRWLNTDREQQAWCVNKRLLHRLMKISSGIGYLSVFNELGFSKNWNKLQRAHKKYNPQKCY